MKRLKPTPVKGAFTRFQQFVNGASVILGCLAAFLVVAFGRTVLQATTSKLSGWTALFLLAVFTGLFVANFLSKQRFVTKSQAICTKLGWGASFIGLLLLAQSGYGLGESLLVVAGIFLISSIWGMRTTNLKQHAFQEPSFASWALRLDALLKFDLPPSIRSSLVLLIEQLWDSPEDLPDFIAAQNEIFSDRLNDLELAIKSHDAPKTRSILIVLSQCLEDRNSLIRSRIQIVYKRIGANQITSAR